MRKKAGPWTLTDNGCAAFRALAGTDGSLLADRVAFIEKTPRVRIREHFLGVYRHYAEDGTLVHEHRQWEDFLNWCEGDKGSDCQDQESRDWCDRMLVALGYELEN